VLGCCRDRDRYTGGEREQEGEGDGVGDGVRDRDRDKSSNKDRQLESLWKETKIEDVLP
jgi:hypothetical protein